MAKFKVQMFAEMPVYDEQTIEIPDDVIADVPADKREAFAFQYVSQLVEQRGITVEWKPVPVPGDEEDEYVAGIDPDIIEIAVDVVDEKAGA